ncbi:MAG: PAS domain-containing sensor histidine kinase [Verrucomicrobiaceae bacterium]|nr:MAG: PAS domain-containing sensor histidine kinase [Verrucomicrobiaceae bacterium]
MKKQKPASKKDHRGSGDADDVAAELVIANKELSFQNEEKGKRAAELVIANKELSFQNEEKEKRAAELDILNTRFQLLLDSTAEGIYGIDMRGECTFCNSACLRMLGYKHEGELLGKNMHWQIHHKHADGTRFEVEECRIFRAFQTNEGSHVDDEVLWRADGTSFPVEYWSYPKRIDGMSVGAVVTFVDTTERKRAEGIILKNVAHAEELARLKLRFVSMASHELRTPLANIMLACELLKNFGTTMPAEKSQSILAGLMAGVFSMAQTIDNLLLAGKIEEGKLPFTSASLPLLGFLRRCCQEVQPELPSRIEIAFHDAGLAVAADEHLLHHILKNLLENALKYSPADTKIGLEVGPANDSLTLTVVDRGIGVPEKDREFLFDAFSRASNVGDKPGSGLGLFTAQKCAQAHGGQLRYSPLPDGSAFSVTIPLTAATDSNPTT